MKKTEISSFKLKEILELRHLGANWVEISNKTKVERRVAKRAYEEWETDQKMREREKIRFRVAAEAFHQHLEDLITVAQALISNLGLPIDPYEKQTSGNHLSNLWQKSILEEFDPYIPATVRVMDRMMDRDSIQRLNLMMFQALQDHTSEKIRWQALDEWRDGWDSCQNIFDNLEIEARKALANILEKSPGFPQEFEERNQQMSRAVVHAIWDCVAQNKFDPLYPTAKVTYESIDKIVTIQTVREINDKVIDICNLAIDNLLKADTLDLVQQLNDEVNKMRKAIDDLSEMLNRPKLYPLILFTHCELCPV